MQELDEIQIQLSALYRLSDELTKNMGTSTIVLLTSRQSAIEQRLVALRQLLSQHIQGLHEDLSQVNRFREAFAAVKTFLEHAETVLSMEDPNKTAEQPDLQNRLDQLKELLTQFQVGGGVCVCVFEKERDLYVIPCIHFVSHKRVHFSIIRLIDMQLKFNYPTTSLLCEC